MKYFSACGTTAQEFEKTKKNFYLIRFIAATPLGVVQVEELGLVFPSAKLFASRLVAQSAFPIIQTADPS